MIRNRQPRRKGKKVTSKNNRKSKPGIVLPPITVMEDEARRLNALASSSAMLFPHVAHFLTQEMERASVVADKSDLRDVVRIAKTRPAKSGTWRWYIRTKRT
jgi:hypothetical protein